MPDGDLAAIIEQAVTETLERLEARRFASMKAPRKGLAETDFAPRSRQIPAAVRRAVRERDGDRLCAAHNRYLAEHDYGKERMVPGAASSA